MDLVKAVQTLNSSEVKRLLNICEPCELIDNYGRSLLHVVVDVFIYDELSNEIQSFSAKQDIIYMLIDSGICLELKDTDGKSCLWYAMENDDPEVCEILLQCGADMFSVSQNGNSVIDEVFLDPAEQEVNQNGKISSELQQVFEKYNPGLWNAVESRDICQVRRLTNLWCKTDLVKNGKTLKELALDSGHEEIISLVYGIHDTMKLIYHILAKNTEAVLELLQNSRKSLQLDLRKMSERGAPILYYLIQWNDSNMIELFVKHGCHVYTIMRDDLGFDMPVLFSALHHAVPVDVIESLLPVDKAHQEELLYKLLYKGLTVLEVALRNRVHPEVFDVIIDRGGPLLLMDRNQKNQSVRHLAEINELDDYVAVIDKNVSSWILHPEKYPKRRESLALFGWEYMVVCSDQAEENSIESNVEDFLNKLQDYRNVIKGLANAIRIGNTEEFQNLRNHSQQFDGFENIITWDGRVEGDGLPLLHRAILFNQPEIAKLILDDKPDLQSVDTLFDQNHRTALHYAYGNPHAGEVRRLLLNSGCSEHVLDRQNKEPLDFRDKKDSSVMQKLLRRLMSEEFHLPEPDPWENEKVTSRFQNTCKQRHDHHRNCHEHHLSSKSLQCDHNFTEDDYIENDTDSEPDSSGTRYYCTIL